MIYSIYRTSFIQRLVLFIILYIYIYLHKIIIMLKIIYNFSAHKLNSYYKSLQLPHTATQKQIKLKFLQLAKQYHPDTGKYKNSEKFKQILQAYKYLSVQSNRTQSQSKTQQNTNTSSQYTYQNDFKYTQEQTIRQKTYSYFNSRPKKVYTQDQTNHVYDSFLETLKAAPQLILITIILLGLCIKWSYSVQGGSNVIKVVQERVFESEQDERQYYRRQKMRQDNRYKFNFREKFEQRK